MKHILKQLILTSLVILLLSGCSIVYINSESIDDIISDTLSASNNLKTVSLEGYSYFLPQGVNLKRSNLLNSELYYNHEKIYLYVDLVSYYHNVANTYSENNNAYYSKKINIDNKSGYLEITELENTYFIEFMYNYSKMEAHVKKSDLNKTLTVMGHILNSVSFQDSLLDSLVGSGSLNYNEEKFNIFKANGNDNSNFLDVIEQYDNGRINSKNEDTLEIEENLE